MNKPDVKIFVVCHRDCYVPDLPFLKPIQVGTALSSTLLPNMLHDNEGDNISEKNKQYCELTAQYWAWKNIEADYYGFFHYRRYFSFNKKQLPEDGWGNVILDTLNAESMQKLSLDTEPLDQLINDYEVITVKKRNINKQRNKQKVKRKTNYEEYGVSEVQHIDDLDKALNILYKKYPEFKKSAEKYLNDTYAYECNMFIMKKDIYFRYCEWLFNILFELEKELDLTYYNSEENRVIGFIAERLFGIYYTYLRDVEKTNTCELQKALIKNTDPYVQINKIEEKYIPIVLAANNKFVPYLATMMESLMENSDKERYYDLIILHRDISKDNQDKIFKQTSKYNNYSVRFANVKQYFDDKDLFVDQHLSLETYYRLAIQDLMPDYDKILYLDSDLIVNDDISKLYDLNIEDSIIAAAKDIDVIGQIKTNPEEKKYIRAELELNDPFAYFQAGVLIINLSQLRKQASVKRLLRIAQSKRWKCHDQDVLNHVCKEKVYYLPQRWNVLMNWKNNHDERMNLLKKTPMQLYEEYSEARKAPAIVHYAGYQKPWNEPGCDMAEYFWKYARETYYYEEIIVRLTEKRRENDQGDRTYKSKSFQLVTGGIQCIRDHGVIYTIKYLPKRLSRDKKK